ncbi:MAG: PqqD family protein [Thermotogae bacterium]|nr:PqqD family protein [Thermotogota bacterium]
MKRRDFLKAAAGLALTVALTGKLKAARRTDHYILNETASRIVELKRKGLDAEGIARRLTEEYEVEFPQAYRDVISFLSEAKRLGIA